MSSFVKKMWPAVAASLVSFTSLASAVDDMQVRNLENRVSALEQRKGAGGMINPPARPVVKDGVDLWIQADAIFWNVTEDGLNVAVENPTSAPSGFIRGNTKNADYDWDWGYRVGAGYNLPHDGWDILANWTHFNTRSKNHHTAEPGSVFLTTQALPGPAATDTVTVTAANAHLHLNMNLADFEMGREFFVSKWLTLRPFGGARGAWLHRTLKVHYRGGSLAVGQKLNDEVKTRWRAGGIRGGLDSQWGLGSGWSFFGQMAMSLLYGRQKASYDEDNISGSGSELEQGDTKNHWSASRAMTDLAIGLRWDRLFSNDAYRIRLQAGWEQHQLFGFNQNMKFVSSTIFGKFVQNQGDLAFSGVFFNARFDF